MSALLVKTTTTAPEGPAPVGPRGLPAGRAGHTIELAQERIRRLCADGSTWDDDQIVRRLCRGDLALEPRPLDFEVRIAIYWLVVARELERDRWGRVGLPGASSNRNV